MKNMISIQDYDCIALAFTQLQGHITPTEERLVWEKSTSIFRERILSELTFRGIGVIAREDLQTIYSFHADEKLHDDGIALIFRCLGQLKQINLSRLGLSHDWIFDWLGQVEWLSLSDNPINRLGALPALKTLFLINIGATDLKLLNQHTQLEALYCGLNPLTDLQAIMEHRPLRLLNCRGCGLNTKKVAAFQQKNPDCQVHW